MSEFFNHGNQRGECHQSSSHQFRVCNSAFDSFSFSITSPLRSHRLSPCSFYRENRWGRRTVVRLPWSLFLVLHGILRRHFFPSLSFSLSVTVIEERKLWQFEASHPPLSFFINGTLHQIVILDGGSIPQTAFREGGWREALTSFPTSLRECVCVNFGARGASSTR